MMKTLFFRRRRSLMIVMTALLVGCWLSVGKAPAQETTDGQTAQTAPANSVGHNLQERFNDVIEQVNYVVDRTLFFDMSFGGFKRAEVDEATQQVKTVGPSVPFMVIFLAFGAIFFTVYHKFINLRGFRHAIQIVRGKFSTQDDPGDITPFRALTSALSATVGLGNIAGVAIALKLGGPGAIFWMMVLGVFGMTAKYHESTLAQIFRKKNEDGSISGGPMYYLDQGLPLVHPSLRVPGKVLAVLFAIFCMAASLGGGNMFQSNQAFEGFFVSFVSGPTIGEVAKNQMEAESLRPLLTPKQLQAARDFERMGDIPLEDVRANLSDVRVRQIVQPSQVEATLDPQEVAQDRQARNDLKGRVSIGFGLLMSALVGIVVIGGITRIGAATCRIVPTMCLLYLVGCLIVILYNIRAIPSHIDDIFKGAFDLSSAGAGLVGVLIIGFQRAAFSSEAGLGSSAIAHSAAKTNEPVREGLVASLEPFIDTIVICFMTAMVVLITDAYKAPELLDEANGSAITLYAFRQTRLGDWFPYLLSVSIVLFAFSTMISWCYYGERAYGYLFGLRTVIVFRLAFVGCVFVGAVASLGPVLDFADYMLLSMAFPNIIGGIILAKIVRQRTREYWDRYTSGTMTPESVASDRFEI